MTLPNLRFINSVLLVLGAATRRTRRRLKYIGKSQNIFVVVSNSVVSAKKLGFLRLPQTVALSILQSLVKYK